MRLRHRVPELLRLDHGQTRRAERKLKRAQRALSRKQKGSDNRAKARTRVARQHAKVADTRSDWLHKATTSIVRENQAIVLEDLAVFGLARTRLVKSVHDASWGQFRRLLQEKAARYGRRDETPVETR